MSSRTQSSKTQSSQALSTANLFKHLADGKPHSGNDLASHFGVSRAAVWKHIERLRELEVPLAATSGKGYQLERPCVPLNAIEINSQTTTNLQVEVLDEIDSTNSYLLKARNPADPPSLCVAEIQTAGRGRRGRSWLAPAGSGLCMSLSYSFEQMPVAPGSVSLAVGVWLIDALQKLGFQELGLKWPNDIYYKKAKLGGILIEMRGELDGRAMLVIGIGLNHQLPADWGEQLDRETADLATSFNGQQLPDRNSIAAACANAVIDKLPEFSKSGFASWRQRWQQLDVLSNQAVHIIDGKPETGIAKGVDDDGALLIENQQQLHRVIAGEVSLRPAS